MTYDPNWWRNAVIYQIYIRSFADGNGDGVGDIAGIRSRLPYLRDLGVDAIWITPWYPSPMADGGYDVADYRDIAPEFGTLDEASALLEEAHEHGLKVILDIVPNHTSDEHEWFRQALEAGPGDPERERYWFRDGRGPDGALPPNDWFSVFGGPAWTRLLDEEGVPEQWYLHLFAPEQPDLKWTNQEVRTEFEDVLRFWFDRGVDGFRIDVAHGLMKHPALPDLGLSMEELLAAPPADHPAWDRPDVHEIYREWRKVADSYEDPRVFVAEAWVHTGSDRLAAYLRPDELHQAFNFDFLRCHWEAQQLRTSIDHSLETLAEVGAPTSWVMSNHDIYRHVTRFGRPPLSSLANRGAYEQLPVDVALGTRRARAAALLMLGLPGSAYVYQGEELGLPDVTDLPEDTLQDPIWERSGNTVRGRDGCRVPLPWSGTSPPFGFGSSDGAEPWLPQPAEWISLTAEAQAEAADSMLSLYRDALRIRREQLAGQPEALTWNKDAPDAVLSFNRGDALRVVVNLGEVPVALPQHVAVALASGPLPHDTLPPDTAAWLQVR